MNTLFTIVEHSAADEKLCENILSIIFETILAPLADVDARLFTPSTAIALTISRANRYSCIWVTNKMLPLLLQQIEINRENRIQKETLLDLTTEFLRTSIDKNVLDKIDNNLINLAQQELIRCLNDDGSEMTSQQNLLNIGLNALTKITEIVTEQNRTIIYKVLSKHMSDADNEAIIRKIIYSFAQHYSDEIMLNIVNIILDPSYLTEANADNAIAILSSLIKLPTFRDVALSFLFEHIFELNQKTIQLIALINLERLIENDMTETLLTDLFVHRNIIDKLVNFVHSNQDLDSNVLLQVSDILRLIVKSLNTTDQTIVIEKYLPVMDLQHTNDLYLTTGILGYMEKDIELLDHFENVVDELTKLSMRTDDIKLTNLSNQLLCSLFNKMPDNEKNKNILKRTVDFLRMEIKKNNKKAIEIVSWISKGLLVRGHSGAAELIDTVNLLEIGKLYHFNYFLFLVIAIIRTSIVGQCGRISL